MKKLFVAILCVFGLTQCHNKAYSLNDLPKEYIQIGSYGGFAGTAKTYFFFPNGQRILSSVILGSDTVQSANDITKATPKDFKEMLKGLNEMEFCDMDLNEIGNMTHFIRLKTKKEDKSVQWSDMNKAPEALVSFYRNTLKNLKTKNTH
ncbi:hypothetical protein OAD66_04565 [Bacteroidia bacterium]|nr:hypothetical protein [Bacteroidia bacterium]MDB9882391.1 hypothetical protein [Bacteroidia bacterium]